MPLHPTQDTSNTTMDKTTDKTTNKTAKQRAATDAKAARPNDGRRPKLTCCLCGKAFKGYGNNPAPAADDGRACDQCNASVVVPRRLWEFMSGSAPRP